MTTEEPNEMTSNEADADQADARSTVTSQREVPPTHGGPGTNWAAVVIAVLALLVVVLVGYLVMAG